MSELPSVALVVPSLNGASYLPTLLDSVGGLNYPRQLLETIVVDNASNDGSLPLLREHYPWVRVLPQAENLGFAEGVNVGARMASARCLALANNDMRLDPDWLRELVRAYDPDAGVPCVAGLILDWEGERIDFADGYATFHGSAGQDRIGERLEEVDVRDGRELLFACGGSMLVDRALFLELGGFDPALFAFFEDVDFGWRLWLAGYQVRLAARARSFHRHHGTVSRFPVHQRTLLQERNALLTLLKNVDDVNLSRLLAPSLFLLVARSLLESRSPRQAYDFGAAAGSVEEVVRAGLAPLHAVGDVLANLESTLDARREIQAHRRRTDAEVFARFRRPFAPSRTEPEYLQAAAALEGFFELDELFVERRATRVVVIAPDGGDRLWTLAVELAKTTPVAFASARPPGRAPGVEVVRRVNDEALAELMAESSLVIVDGASSRSASLAVRARGLLAVDVQADASPELIEAADVLLCGSQALYDLHRRTGEQPGRRQAVLLVRDADSQPLKALVEEPARFRSSTRPPAATEDVQALLAHWRREYGVSRGTLWQLSRTLWRALPERLRARVARLRRTR